MVSDTRRAARAHSTYRHAEEAQAFLIRAGEDLARSLDYETTLQIVAHQAVPVLADLCVVDLVGPDGRLSPVAAAHVDTAKENWARELAHLGDTPATALRVFRTGQPLITPEISDTFLSTIAQEEQVPLNPQNITAMRELRVKSAISIPLVARDRILGVLSLGRHAGSVPFTPQDVPVAQQLARQCAQAVDNARLYREANEAVLAREEFLAATSHELRRPLSEIKGFATTLLRTDVQWDDATRRDFLAEIDREADLLDALISDLLDMSLLGSGGGEKFDRAPTAPAVLVSRSSDRASSRLSHAALTIDPELGTLPLVWVDARRIEQVLTNLVENAAKYAPGSPIHISGAVAHAGGAVELWVEDEGPGIAADDLPHIFETFYRGRSPERATTPGTGLGLAIACRIVEGHGGHIRAENRTGGGARFIFSLPVASSTLRRRERR